MLFIPFNRVSPWVYHDISVGKPVRRLKYAGGVHLKMAAREIFSLCAGTHPFAYKSKSDLAGSLNFDDSPYLLTGRGLPRVGYLCHRHAHPADTRTLTVFVRRTQYHRSYHALRYDFFFRQGAHPGLQCAFYHFFLWILPPLM